MMTQKETVLVILRDHFEAIPNVDIYEDQETGSIVVNYATDKAGVYFELKESVLRPDNNRELNQAFNNLRAAINHLRAAEEVDNTTGTDWNQDFGFISFYYDTNSTDEKVLANLRNAIMYLGFANQILSKFA